MLGYGLADTPLKFESSAIRHFARLMIAALITTPLEDAGRYSDAH